METIENTCTNCGAPLPLDARVCDRCGTPVGAVAEAKPKRTKRVVMAEESSTPAPETEKVPLPPEPVEETPPPPAPVEPVEPYLPPLVGEVMPPQETQKSSNSCLWIGLVVALVFVCLCCCLVIGTVVAFFSVLTPFFSNFSY